MYDGFFRLQDYGFVEFSLPESAAACKKAHEARNGRFGKPAASGTPAAATPTTPAVNSIKAEEKEGAKEAKVTPADQPEPAVSDKPTGATSEDTPAGGSKVEPSQQEIGEATKAAAGAAADDKPSGDISCTCKKSFHGVIRVKSSHVQSNWTAKTELAGRPIQFLGMHAAFCWRCISGPALQCW